MTTSPISLQAIERIQRYTEYIDETGFLHNDLVQDAVIRNVEIIGEAARNIARHYPEFAQKHAEIPWEDVYLMRNRVSHGYFSVAVVWKTVQRDIPELRQWLMPLVQKV